MLAKLLAGLDLLAHQRGLLGIEPARLGAALHDARHAVVRPVARVGAAGARAARLVALHVALGHRAAPHRARLSELIGQAADVRGNRRVRHRSSLRILYPQERHAASTEWPTPHSRDVRPTVRVDLTRRAETQADTFASRCHDGNYAMTAMLSGARVEDKAFAEGRGPDPATKCYVRCGNNADVNDPLGN